MTLDKPTIGVAKNLLCGIVQSDGLVKNADKVLGYVVNARKQKLYVNTGYRIRESDVRIIWELGRNGMPEALKAADANSKLQKRGKGG
jgi:deoxyinosine 3'endonuclease (endonuclease V)